MIYLGIDFGTTNATAAFVRDDPRYGKQTIVPVEVIQADVDESGLVQTGRIPTILWLAAWNVMKVGWEFFRSVFSPKLLPMLRRGHNFFSSVKSDLGACRVYPHAASPDCNTPEKIAMLLFQRILNCVRSTVRDLDLACTPVVITVPASLSGMARDETLAAAVGAGLSRSRIELIDEPLAAALDWLHSSAASEHLNTRDLNYIMVLDWGGGTLDYCVICGAFDLGEQSGLIAENIAISRYQRNGGDKIDQKIMERVLWPQVEKNLGVSRTTLSPAVRKSIEDTLTLTVARRLKENLCRRISREIGPDGDPDSIQTEITEVFVPDAEFHEPRLGARLKGPWSLTKSAFEQIMNDCLPPCLDDHEDLEESLFNPIPETLDKADLAPSDLDVLVLHGGACHNPYVRSRLTQLLTECRAMKTRIVQTPDLDTSVARGAALACYWKHARSVELIPPVASAEIGIMTLGDQAVRLIRRGERLPFPANGQVVHPIDFHVPQSNQHELIVPFYAGEDQRTICGVVTVPLPDGTQQGDRVKIKLQVGADKILHWSYSVAGQEFSSAPCVEDPWTPRQLSRSDKKVLEHRRKMRAAVESGTGVSRSMKLREAYLLYRADRYDEAELCVADCIAEEGQDGESANILALIHASKHDLTTALDLARSAVNLCPKDAVLLGNYAIALNEAGRTQEAISRIHESLKLNPGLAYLHEHLGNLYRKESNEESAIHEYRQAVRITEKELRDAPELIEGLTRLQRLYALLGDNSKSRWFGAQAQEAELNDRYLGKQSLRIAGPESPVAEAVCLTGVERLTV